MAKSARRQQSPCWTALVLAAALPFVAFLKPKDLGSSVKVPAMDQLGNKLTLLGKLDESSCIQIVICSKAIDVTLWPSTSQHATLLRKLDRPYAVFALKRGMRIDKSDAINVIQEGDVLLKFYHSASVDVLRVDKTYELVLCDAPVSDAMDRSDGAFQEVRQTQYAELMGFVLDLAPPPVLGGRVGHPVHEVGTR